MKKLAKSTLIVIGIFVLLIAAAALILPRVMDPNKHKERITALVKEKTGRDFNLPGNISVSVFPWLGAKIGSVELGNADGFQGPLFARAEQIQVRVKLLPLISRRVEADVVSVRGLTLNLERNKEGRTNWDDLIKTPTAPSTGKQDASPASISSAAMLAVGGLEIKDAQVNWTDYLAGTNIALNHLTVKTSEVNLVDPIKIKIGFDLDTGDIGIATTVDTAGRITLDLKNQRYNINDLALKADLRGKSIPGGSASVTATGNAAFDAATQKIDMTGVRLEALGLASAPYTAGVVIETSGSGGFAAGNIDLKAIDATLTLTEGEDRAIAHLAGAVQGDLKNKKFTVSDLILGLPELNMKGIRGKITAPGSGSARVDLSADTFALDNIALAGTLSGEPIPGKSIPVAINLQLRGDLNRQSIIMEPLRLDVAGIKTTTSLAVNQFKEAPQIKGTLTVAAFNPRDLFASFSLTPPGSADPKVFSSGEFSAAFLADTDTLTIDKLMVRLDDTRLTGTLAMKHFSAPEVRLDLALDSITPERYLPAGAGEGAARHLTDTTLKGDLATDAGFKIFRVKQLAVAGKMDKKIPFGITAGDTTINLDDQTISADRLLFKAGEIDLQVKAGATGISTKPAYTADIRAETFNLRPMLSDLGLLPETADPRAMSAVGLSASLGGTADAVSVSSIKLRLDDTRIEGRADITFSPASAYTFDIRLDGIDADRYLPPPKTESTRKKDAGPIATPGAAAAALPVDILKGLDLDGKISIGKLKISNLRLAEISAQARAKDGLLRLNPFTAGLYGGSYTGDIRLDARGQAPRLELDEKLSGIRAGDLLNDLQGKALVTGITDAEMKLTGTGADTDAILGTLGGNAAFRIADGSIKGVDIAEKICRTLSAVNAGSLKKEGLVGSALQLLVQKATGTKQPEADRTMFSEMGGSMEFLNGVGTGKDLMLKSPLLRVQGSGTLDLPKRYLDYQATAALVKSCEGQGGKSFSDLENYPIPVAITGLLDKLEVKPDLTTGILGILERSRKKPSQPQSTETSEQTGDTPSPAPDNTQPDPSSDKPIEKVVRDLLQDLLKKE